MTYKLQYEWQVLLERDGHFEAEWKSILWGLNNDIPDFYFEIEKDQRGLGRYLIKAKWTSEDQCKQHPLPTKSDHAVLVDTRHLDTIVNCPEVSSLEKNIAKEVLDDLHLP